MASDIHGSPRLAEAPNCQAELKRLSLSNLELIFGQIGDGCKGFIPPHTETQHTLAKKLE